MRLRRRTWLRWTLPAGLLFALHSSPFGESARAAEAVLIGAGDIAKCGSRLGNAEATAELIDQFFAHNSAVESVVFTVGDNVYPRGRGREFENCYDPTWGRHKARTRPAVGNHEYKTRDAQPYFDYFGKQAGDRGKGYYSYRLGDWHVIALNSVCDEVGGCGADSPQFAWLEKDLQKNHSPCTVAYMHHPRFSSGKHGANRGLHPLFALLYEHGVEVVLSGHDHHYERFVPLNPDGVPDPERGIQQFIVGTGGRELRRVRRLKPGSAVADRTSYGVLKLTLKSGEYEWEFLPAEGSRFQDSGTRKCH